MASIRLPAYNVAASRRGISQSTMVLHEMRYALAKLGTIALALLAAGGCISSDSSPSGHSPSAPRPKSYPIAVYSGSPGDTDPLKGQPLIPYEQIPRHTKLGNIKVTGAPAASWQRMFSNAKAKARQMGADAIVLVEAADAGMGGKALDATAIRFTDRP
jgi:hypothetical protein